MFAQLSSMLNEPCTNEVEILVFRIDAARYGVAAASVREIIAGGAITALPQSHPAVRGNIRLRERIVPLVELRRFFRMPPAENDEHSRIIVMEFNSEPLAFLVDHVDRLHRLSGKAITRTPRTGGEQEQTITSVAHINGEMVLMPDFEQIAFQITGASEVQAAGPLDAEVDRASVTILLANNSEMMRTMLTRSLEDSGFGRIIAENDGKAALTALEEMVDSASPPDIVVTDIQMPRMNGLRLTKCIKEDPRLKGIPVIAFGSLAGNDDLKKCRAVGADRQLTMPQLPTLVEAIDDVLMNLATA